MRPDWLGPKVREKPTVNQRSEPMASPVNVCISMLRAFFLRMIPACASPSAGVWSITKVEAMIMKAVSPSLMGWQETSQVVALWEVIVECVETEQSKDRGR